MFTLIKRIASWFDSRPHNQEHRRLQEVCRLLAEESDNRELALRYFRDEKLRRYYTCLADEAYIKIHHLRKEHETNNDQA